jgi:hypothetical protein
MTHSLVDYKYIWVHQYTKIRYISVITSIEMIGACLLLLSSFSATNGASEGSHVFYLSSSGSDSNDGSTAATAFLTPLKAQQAVRSRSTATGATRSAEVRVLPGTFFLNNTLIFGELDGGSNHVGVTVTWVGWAPEAQSEQAPDAQRWSKRQRPQSTFSFGIPVPASDTAWSKGAAPNTWTRTIQEVVRMPIFSCSPYLFVHTHQLITSMTIYIHMWPFTSAPPPALRTFFSCVVTPPHIHAHLSMVCPQIRDNCCCCFLWGNTEEPLPLSFPFVASLALSLAQSRLHTVS